jgi:hypothetical protein
MLIFIMNLEFQMANYFLSLGRGRTSDGKKNFQRSPNGLRAIYDEDAAKVALKAQHDAGNLKASLVLTDRAVSKSAKPVGLTYHLDNGMLICDQYPNVALKVVPDGYLMLVGGNFHTKSVDLASIKEEVKKWAGTQQTVNSADIPADPNDVPDEMYDLFTDDQRDIYHRNLNLAPAARLPYP